MKKYYKVIEINRRRTVKVVRNNRKKCIRVYKAIKVAILRKLLVV